MQMSLVETLITFFKKPAEETKGKTPEGMCPNCWGNQEYDLVIRELYKDKQIDVNNHAANHSFINAAVVKRIDGIRLIKGTSGFVCNTCKTIIPKI